MGFGSTVQAHNNYTTSTELLTLYRLPLYERYVVLSLFVLLEAEGYIGIFGWLFMAKCHSNNFNVSKGLVHSAQTEQ